MTPKLSWLYRNSRGICNDPGPRPSLHVRRRLSLGPTIEKNPEIPVEALCYQWKGMNRIGEAQQGFIESSSIQTAKITLWKQGILVKSITRQTHVSILPKSIKSNDITLLTRHLATLIKSSIPLIQSLELIAKTQTNQPMKRLIQAIKQQIESGLSFSESLRQHPLLFKPFFCNVIAAGEVSGTLDVMLERLATHHEKIEALKKKVKQAMTYPIIIVIMSALISAGLLMYVIPQFESLFQQFHADLPWATQQIIRISQGFQAHSIFIEISLVGMLAILMYCKKHVPAMNYRLGPLLIKIPLLGTLLHQTAMAKFSRTLSILFNAGLPLKDALNSVAEVVHFRPYTEATIQIILDISNGYPLHIAMENTRLFPDLAIQLINIGEKSGTLDHLLEKLADHYENAVDHQVETFCRLLEPGLMIVLGLGIGGLIFALYLPIITLGTVIS